MLTRQLLDDSSKLDRSKFFNVHSSYTAPALTEADLQQLKDLNVGFGRSFDGPFAGHRKGELYQDSESVQAAGEEAIKAAESDLLYRFHTTRRIITDEVQHVFNMEHDPKEMARFAVDVLEFHYTDETRPDFYSPLSIPFVAAGKYGEDEAVVRERMSQFIAEVGKAIDQRALSTQVIGYTSAWPMMHFWDFGHWKRRMQLFLDTAGDYLDGVCFLLMDASYYDAPDKRRSGSRVEALMDLIETYGFIKWGAPKPFAFSEYGTVAHGWPQGDAYSPARSSAELNAYNHFLFSLLGREDRISIAVPFISTKSPWFYCVPNNNWQPYSADLWRPDPDSVVDGEPTRFFETEKMNYYRLWSDVQGDRVRVISDHPDVVSYAFVDGKEAYVCFNNADTSECRVAIGLAGKLPAVSEVEMKRMYIPKGEAVVYTQIVEQKVPRSIVLRPYETVVMCISFSDTLYPSTVVRTQSHYSKDFLQPIVASKLVKFTILADGVTPEADGILRVSIARGHELSKQPQLSINGRTIEFPVNWLADDQSNREGGFFGAIEISVPAGILKPTNEVTLTFPDSGGRVSTVVLESNTVLAIK